MALERVGPYRVEGQVGWGGFARVYRARAGDGTPVLLKVADQSGQGTVPAPIRPARAVEFVTGCCLRRGRLDRDTVIEMFGAEARALRSAAGHRLPRLIEELAAGDGMPVLVLEPLGEPWSLEAAPVGDFARLLDACADLGRAGLDGHGDLKPEHVFLRPGGEFVFIDPAYRHEAVCTMTPEYVPWPYLSRPGADVCAVAVMVHQWLTGAAPGGSPDWRTQALAQLERLQRGRGRPRPGLAADGRALAGAARWAAAVLGWVHAVLEAGGDLFTRPVAADPQAGLRAAREQPGWLGDHSAAAAQLRAATARPRWRARPRPGGPARSGATGATGGAGDARPGPADADPAASDPQRPPPGAPQPPRASPAAPAAEPPAAIPARVGGYPVLGVLGDGPCGHTYLVRRDGGRLAAVKVLRPAIDAGPDPAPRLLRTAQAICDLPASSPHLARVFDAGIDGGAVWLARDYIDGPTLQAAVAEHGPLPAARLRALAAATAAALAALHASGIRHGNLKPGNVLLAADRPVVVDAGVACPQDPTVVLPDSVRAGAAYLAPEQVAGDPVTLAADVHSWGALVVFAATGRAPFTGPDWFTVLHRLISDPPDLGTLQGDLRRLTATAMAKDQASRPTAQQLLQTLSG